MSHAVNLVSRHQSESSKRRKTSSSDKQFSNGVNGILQHGQSLKAVPSRKAKANKNSTLNAAIRTDFGQTDATDQVDAAEGDQDDDEDSQKEDDDDDDDDDDESDMVVDEDRRPRKESRKLHERQAEAGQQEAVADSFGDLLRQRGEEPVNVDLSQDALSSKLPLHTATNRTLSLPNANSLGTILTQALRTNDVDLLESCLQVNNLDSIRATIERLHPSHASTLLQKLAERMHRRPGRAGSLMVWVQWTVVAHGAYLATQPAATKELRTLYKVVRQRASSLQPMLLLKGKLDMLEAQAQLRRSAQKRLNEQGPAVDEQVTVYIEGQEDEEDNEGNAAAKTSSRRRQVNGLNHDIVNLEDDADEAAGEDLDMLDDDDEEVEDDDDESESDQDDEEEDEDEDDDEEDEEEVDDSLDGDLIDDEAEVSDGESEDEDDENSDLDNMDGVKEVISDSDEEVRPPKKSRKGLKA